eukprot:10591348-Heterocapsa_arctica.AAC.2
MRPLPLPRGGPTKHDGGRGSRGGDRGAVGGAARLWLRASAFPSACRGGQPEGIKSQRNRNRNPNNKGHEMGMQASVER